jgi:hypothetical protein
VPAAGSGEESTVHVLTKIFIVLVSLLAVLLVPLVVVYAHNEDSFKAKYEAAAALAAAANQNLETEGITHAEERARMELQVRELTGENKTLARERESALTDVRRLDGELAEARSQQAEIRADLATISSAVSAGQDLIESLLSEVRTMRSEALAAERRSVELDEALRDITGQLESAVAARRAVQEELQQLREEHARALERVAVYVEKYGRVELEGGPRPAGGEPGRPGDDLFGGLGGPGPYREPAVRGADDAVGGAGGRASVCRAGRGVAGHHRPAGVGGRRPAGRPGRASTAS